LNEVQTLHDMLLAMLPQGCVGLVAGVLWWFVCRWLCRAEDAKVTSRIPKINFARRVEDLSDEEVQKEMRNLTIALAINSQLLPSMRLFLSGLLVACCVLMLLVVTRLAHLWPT
jgi:hypothetical protein